MTVTPGVCVLTSLAPDHLDWHGGEEAYYRDKLRLIEAGPPGALAVNAASDEAVRRTAGHPDRTCSARPGGSGSTPGGSRSTATGWSTRPGCGTRGGTTCGTCAAPSPGSRSCREPPRRPRRRGGGRRLRGTAVPVPRRRGARRPDVRRRRPGLQSLRHRGLAGAFPGRPLTVILGGADRGVDPAVGGGAVPPRPLPAVVVLPPDRTGWPTPSPAVPEGPSRGGGGRGRRPGGRGAGPWPPPRGGVVLFSPAAPTPDGDGGYGERSRRFVAAAGLALTRITARVAGRE